MTDSIEDEPKLGNQNEEAEEEEKSCLVPNTPTSSNEMTDQKESKIDIPKDEDEIIHELARSDGDPSITQVVIGTDDRVKVEDTTEVPYEYICQLLIEFPSDWWWWCNSNGGTGTGWICNTGSSKYDVVVTSAHNLVIPSKDTGGEPIWATSVTVIPGCNGAGRPYGEYKVESQQLRASADFFKGGPDPIERSNYDFGAILIPKTGKLRPGLPMLVIGSPMSREVTISGYPGSGGPNGKSPGGYQWKDSGNIENDTPYTLIYSIDTSPGQSGSPILLQRRSTIYGIGIHRGPAKYQSMGLKNDGVRITGGEDGVFSQILKWGNGD